MTEAQHPASERPASQPPTTLAHRLTRMTGRNPRESHRASTPLELLFDLTFVVAFGAASDGLSHYLAAGHIGAAIGGFIFTMFATCWAWINFSWFASAYDTDDWFYRITTMVQMIGVLVLALGAPAVFSSLDEGVQLDNHVAVAGYVIMRVAMVAQWLRVAQQDPLRRRTALTYVLFITIAQIGWVLFAVLNLPLPLFLAFAPLLYVVELMGPIVAERKVGGDAGGTPWHPHHIAERYGLLAIIALGEGILGTIASVSALVQHQGWSPEAVSVVIAGVGLTFGLWWTYFILPSGEVLSRHRARAFPWGYAHIFVYISITAVGAGLHLAAYVIEGQSKIGVVGTVVAVAVPALVYAFALYGIYTFLVQRVDPLHIGLLAGTVLVVAFAIWLAFSGASLGVCLLVLTLGPAVTVVGYETLGHRHAAAVLEKDARG
jgi:low temperature requirement protein LtrA